MLQVSYAQVKLSIRTRRISQVSSQPIVRAHRIASEDISLRTLGQEIDIEEQFAPFEGSRSGITRSKLPYRHTIVDGVLLALLRAYIVIVATAKRRVTLVIFLDSTDDLLKDLLFGRTHRGHHLCRIGVLCTQIVQHARIFLVAHIVKGVNTFVS